MLLSRNKVRLAAFGLIGMVGATASFPSIAQEARPATPERPEATRIGEAAKTDAGQSLGVAPQAAASGDRLPTESRTSHALASGDRTLRFIATAGALPITNSQGRVLAEIAYTAYVLDAVESQKRPVTFAFNGGPGSASTWLHLGAFGPWRMPLTMETARPSATPTLLPNADSWLDFTDLVFIDPVGTGYSHIVNETSSSGAQGPGSGGRGANREVGGPGWFWSVGGDVESISDFILSWLTRNDRLASPKMIAGESYGGFRGPRIAQFLQRQRGVGINAMVLISPVLDFAYRRGGHQPLYFAGLLPSLGAAALERKGEVPSRTALQSVEDYARGEFLLDLMRGPRDSAAVERVVVRVAAISGLPSDTVRRYGGRFGGAAYVREVYGPSRRVASFYDVSMTGFDPYPTAPGSRFDDPFVTGIEAPMTSAMREHYRRLGWHVGRPYVIASDEATSGWIWGNSANAPESVSSIGEVLALDPRFRLLVTHGFTDTITPYLASQLLLEQLPDYGEPNRVTLNVYAGGHMHYSRDATRAALHADAAALLVEALREPARPER